MSGFPAILAGNTLSKAFEAGVNNPWQMAIGIALLMVTVALLTWSFTKE